MYCKNCGNEIDSNAAICVRCGFQKGQGDKYCHHCGNEVVPGASVCMKCGFAQTIEDVIPPGVEQKSKMVAGLLGIFLGGWGVHSFYLGDTKRGIIHILLVIPGGFVTWGLSLFGNWIWGLVEGIMILCGSKKKDARGIPLK